MTCQKSDISALCGEAGASSDEPAAAVCEAPAVKPSEPIDVYDAATYMAITALSEQSVAMGGLPQAFPDFTHGKWTSGRRPCGGAYCLDRDGVF